MARWGSGKPGSKLNDSGISFVLFTHDGEELGEGCYSTENTLSTET